MLDEGLPTRISRRTHRTRRNSVADTGSPMREAGGNSRMADSRIPRGTEGTVQASDECRTRCAAPGVDRESFDDSIHVGDIVPRPGKNQRRRPSSWRSAR